MELISCHTHVLINNSKSMAWVQYVGQITNILIMLEMNLSMLLHQLIAVTDNIQYMFRNVESSHLIQVIRLQVSWKNIYSLPKNKIMFDEPMGYCFIMKLIHPCICIFFLMYASIHELALLYSGNPFLKSFFLFFQEDKLKISLVLWFVVNIW